MPLLRNLHRRFPRKWLIRVSQSQPHPKLPSLKWNRLPRPKGPRRVARPRRPRSKKKMLRNSKMKMIKRTALSKSVLAKAHLRTKLLLWSKREKTMPTRSSIDQKPSRKNRRMVRIRVRVAKTTPSLVWWRSWLSDFKLSRRCTMVRSSRFTRTPRKSCKSMKTNCVAIIWASRIPSHPKLRVRVKAPTKSKKRLASICAAASPPMLSMSALLK